MTFHLTPRNADERKPVPTMTRVLWGKLVDDKRYLSHSLFEELYARGLHLITPNRKNMANRLMPLWDKLLIRQLVLVETVNDQLKNISQIAHTPHRSPTNVAVNLLAGLTAYTHQPNKPSLNLSPTERRLLPALI